MTLRFQLWREFAQQGIAMEHYFLNGIVACRWQPGARDCTLCAWHRLDIVVPEFR